MMPMKSLKNTPDEKLMEALARRGWKVTAERWDRGELQRVTMKLKHWEEGQRRDGREEKKVEDG